MPTLSALQGASKPQNVFCERERRRVSDLVRTRCGALLDYMISAKRESEKAGTYWLNVSGSWAALCTLLHLRNVSQSGGVFRGV